MKTFERILNKMVVPEFDSIEGVTVMLDPSRMDKWFKVYLVIYFVNKPDFKYTPEATEIKRRTETLYKAADFPVNMGMQVRFSPVFTVEM